QVQLANHTWSHPSMLKLSDSGVVQELSRNDDFIRKTYAVDPKPYFRPPFGFHDARVDRVAASIGYSTPVLWYGSLSDSGPITVDQLKGFADKWMLPQHIVIGHANFLPVTQCFDYLVELIRSRGLQPVTLNDVFVR
ncbi:MAG: polysaccharide deacetylase family protein, partial [Lacisediminihabitans sp.]